MSETRPNILLVMADQLAPMFTGAYGHSVVQTPSMNTLADSGVRFDAAYSPCPVCSPARASLMTGMYPPEIGAWDNGSELPADVTTFAHHLRLAGYATCLSGKMHFVGPDQLHGFEERLTTDVYPADYKWTPDWDTPLEPKLYGGKPLAIYHVTAGVTQWSQNFEYDEEAHFHALQWLRARRTELSDRDSRPFCLCVSYQHPHNPFHTTRGLWDLYEGIEIDIPMVPDDMEAHVHPMDYWINVFHGVDRVDLMNPETLYNLRRAYYANTTYIDRKLGELIATLKQCGLNENTIIFFTSDHGDMLAERGMVQKRTFYEYSVRVPLIAHYPGHWGPGRVVNDPISLMDLAPTFVELGAGQEPSDMSGRSLVPLLEGYEDRDKPREVISTWHSHGIRAACFMIRRGKYKYIYVHGEAPQLYDLDEDPGEWNNLASQAAYADLEADLKARILSQFDPDEIEARVRDSQRRRLFIREAGKMGKRTSWDYQPFVDASHRFRH